MKNVSTPTSPTSADEGVRIVIISFRNKAKKNSSGNISATLMDTPLNISIDAVFPFKGLRLVAEHPA